MLSKLSKKQILIIIGAVILIIVQIPSIISVGLLFYMGKANHDWEEKKENVWSQNCFWVDTDEKFTLFLSFDQENGEYGVLTNNETNHSVRVDAVPASSGIRFALYDSEDSTRYPKDSEWLGWGDWDCNDDLTVFTLAIESIDDDKIHLEDGAKLVFHRQEKDSAVS